MDPIAPDDGDWGNVLDRALQGLTVGEAAALQLIYHGGLTQRQVAVQLGQSRDETKRLVSSGLRMLGREIGRIQR